MPQMSPIMWTQIMIFSMLIMLLIKTKLHFETKKF
uniref:ATP synthase F0 subunit 8 n=1 Tax=Oliarus cf. filicicola HI01081 TaxID=2879485 RepID=A0A8K1MBE7_9HEMI|nr:ATP synthase F0 subunit 8 [Oliarus cf. filicicola HI01081]